MTNYDPHWYNDIRTIRKMMDVDVEANAVPCCPSCHVPFDKGKKRRLIDACGHERCYSCIFSSDQCTVCLLEATAASNAPTYAATNRPVGLETRATMGHLRPRLKTNGHFTTFMQSRCESNTGKASPERTFGTTTTRGSPPLQARGKYAPSPRMTRTTWQQRRHMRPNTVSVDGESALSDDDVPSRQAAPRVVEERHPNNDLYMRLGLLLGESAAQKTTTTTAPPRADSTNNSSQESYASVSSLASSEANTSGSTNTSPLSTLTASSETEPLGPLGCLRSSGRDHSSDSVTSLMSTSTSTGHSSSTSPVGTSLRRQILTRTNDNTSPFGRRGSSTRRSNRNSGAPLCAIENKARNFSSRNSHIALKPLFFEVPQTEPDPLFVGRQWLFKEIQQELVSESSSSRGIVIIGGPGSGKSAIILQLVDYSSFGRKKEEALYEDGISTDGSDQMSTYGSSIYQSRLTLNQDTARSLGSHVVAYHFCQVDNNATCLVPEFVHSIASQLCQAPQLVAFRELLLQETRYQDLLSMHSCIADPSTAFVNGVLEPLKSLRRLNKIPNTTCLIVIDALNEAEFHRPDYGDTITSFIERHILEFPSWLKVIVTVRTVFQEVTKLLPFSRISLDRLSANDNLQRDVYNYIICRINSSPAIRANVTITNTKIEGSAHARFASHLASLSKGCMLYVKLTMDLFEKGHLLVKSSSYKVLPVSLSEVYLLSFNLKFTTQMAFDKVSSIIQACLASLYPMTREEIYYTVNAGTLYRPILWEDFLQRLQLLINAQFLVSRQDRSLVFAHPSLREWLLRREENENTKFLCDARPGHAMIAFRLSRLEAPLDADRCMELGHHILKAHIYKNVSRNLPASCLPRDLQALWVLHSTDDISSSLGSLRNVYSPNVKVSRLLLLAGASPDQCTEQLCNAPLLGVAAYEGFHDMVSLLLEFGANVNVTSSSGTSPLCFAAQQGHLDIVRLLLTRGAKINQTDSSGMCSLVHAAKRGHLNIVSYLVQCDWPTTERKNEPSLSQAAQQALTCAAKAGHVNVVEYLLDMAEVRINSSDELMGHTALTAASSAGKTKVCDVLLHRGASVSVSNLRQEPPIACAVIEGQWAVAELLLSHKASLEQTDGYGRTALMLAAAEGHLGILELLLSKRASTCAADKEGLTALCWACLKGQVKAVQCLLDHGSDVNHCDVYGRTPLDLAALNGDPRVVQLLLDKGAVIEHVDHEGMRPLDRAIGKGNRAAVERFLNKGAKLGTQTWTLAEGQPSMLSLLLNKLLEDGMLLCKKNRLKEAAHRFQYALKKFPNDTSTQNDVINFQQLRFQLLLGLSRCKRKMNEFERAIEASDQAIDIRPKSFEGYYARARARKEIGQFDKADQDVIEALRLAPQNPEIRKILLKLKEDILSCTKEACISPCPGVEGLVSPQTTSASTASGSSGISDLHARSCSTETIDQVCGFASDALSPCSGLCLNYGKVDGIK